MTPTRAGLLPPAWRLVDARRALGLTQAALASRLGVDARTIARWERARRADAMLQHAFASVGESLRREHLRRVLALTRHGAAVADSRRRRAAALRGHEHKESGNG